MKGKEMKGKAGALRRYLLSLCITLVFVFAASTMAFAEDAVNVPVKTTGYEAQLVKTYTINLTTPRRVIPLNVTQPGTIQIDLKVKALQRNMDVGVYTDAACTNRLSGFYSFLETGDTTKGGQVSVSTAGTYYLKLESSVYSSTGAFTNTVDVCLGEYTKSIKTLTSSIKYYRKNSSDVYKFKYKAPKTGKVYVTVDSSYGYYVKLEDANQKPLNSEFAFVGRSGSGLVHDGKIGYAVKKGKTYHFAVKTIASNEYQTISVSSVKTVKEKSGATKKKATTIKAKKKINGLLLAGENKADWYKLKLSKRKKLTITVKGEPNTDQNYKDGFKISVYDKNGKLIDSANLRDKKGVYTVTNSRKYGYADKGTYYIKISPLTKKKSSGYYTITWK